MQMADKIRFMLDGCDICFVAEAPEDITLKQLLKQCDRIKPDYCACGIRSLTKVEEGKGRWPNAVKTEIIIEYDDIYVNPDNNSGACKIMEDGSWMNE